MHCYLRGLILLFLFMTPTKPVFADQAANYRIYGINFIPDLLVEQSYTSNLFYQPNNTLSTWQTIATPTIEANIERGYFKGKLQFRNQTSWYSESSDDNYSDNSLKLGLSWHLSHRNLVEFESAFEEGHTARGTESSEGNVYLRSQTPDTFIAKSLLGRYVLGNLYSKGRFELSTYISEIKYTNNKLNTEKLNHDMIEGRGIFYFKVGGSTSSLVELRISETEYSTLNGFPNRRSENFLIGLSKTLSGKAQSHLKVGYKNISTKSINSKPFTGINWDVKIEWQPHSYTKLTLKTYRAESEPRSDAAFIDSKNNYISWSVLWSSRFESIFELEHLKDSFIDSPVYRSDFKDKYSLNLRYNLRRWFNLGLKASNYTRESNINTYDFERADISLYINVSI